MHVDGFRFDLASTLARELHEVDRLSAFFDIIQQDPVISQVKLIAEPWDSNAWCLPLYFVQLRIARDAADGVLGRASAEQDGDDGTGIR